MMTQAKLETYLAARARSVKTEVRPANPRRREAILAVAHEVFLESGYEAASMSGIAARLGGSKGTLYSYFDSKEALFTALVVEHCTRSREAVFDIPAGLPFDAALSAIARGYIRLVNSDLATRMLQIVAAEARRWPALGALFHESGPAAAIARLAELLGEQGADAGLAIDDAVAAAETFLTLCRGALHLRRVLGLAAEPDAATITREADRAVAAFQRLYGA